MSVSANDPSALAGPISAPLRVPLVLAGPISASLRVPPVSLLPTGKPDR